MIRRHPSSAVPRRLAAVAILTLAACGSGWPGGCTVESVPGDAASLFARAPRVPRGGDSITVANIAALGTLACGDVLDIDVQSDTGRFVLILRAETGSPPVGLLGGGGAIGETLRHTVAETGDYFVFVVHDAASPIDGQSAEISANRVVDTVDRRPARQLVYVRFEPGYLSDPGLWDPLDGSEEDLAFLESIAPAVRTEVARQLRDIFAEAPIEVTDVEPSKTDGPYSTLTFSPQRMLADQDDVNDAALPPPDPTRPECQVRVVFGEVLPRGTDVDPGNRQLDDDAVVYVGSFQGRGQSCWTSAVSSFNSVVLTLSQTAAHEIGHLVGLFHVEQIDLMNRSATLAFLRDLEFARGQIQLDRRRNGTVVSEVFPAIVQEPKAYFQSIFAVDGDASP